MQKWIGHVAIMSNKISNLIVFEIFDSDTNICASVSTRVLLRFAGFKLESARHPCSASLSVGNLLSTTKRTVENKYKISANFQAEFLFYALCTTMYSQLFCSSEKKWDVYIYSFLSENHIF
jgi:hypothetical protein